MPSLFSVVRASHLPTTVRVSAVSLLGQCVETNATAMTAYVVDLVSAMVDLVQIESVPLQALPGKNKDKDTNIVGTGAVGAAVFQTGQSDAADVITKVNGSASGKTKGKVKAGRSKGVNEKKPEEGEEEKVRENTTMDSNPTEANPKFPPAAACGIALLGTARAVDDSEDLRPWGRRGIRAARHTHAQGQDGAELHRRDRPR